MRPVTQTVAPEIIVPSTEGPDVPEIVPFVHRRIQPLRNVVYTTGFSPSTTDLGSVLQRTI